jgi:hypothetical protein
VTYDEKSYRHALEAAHRKLRRWGPATYSFADALTAVLSSCSRLPEDRAVLTAVELAQALTEVTH